MKTGYFILIVLILSLSFLIIGAGCSQEKTKEEFCTNENASVNMSFSEARQIALSSDCMANGTLKETHFCNNGTGTWWIDMNINKVGCNPACVVNIETRQAEINWRCTGLLPDPKEVSCINSGGNVTWTTCHCANISDFYDSCAIQGCRCMPDYNYTKQVRICDCGAGKCFYKGKCVKEIPS